MLRSSLETLKAYLLDKVDELDTMKLMQIKKVDTKEFLSDAPGWEDTSDVTELQKITYMDLEHIIDRYGLPDDLALYLLGNVRAGQRVRWEINQDFEEGDEYYTHTIKFYINVNYGGYEYPTQIIEFKGYDSYLIRNLWD